MSALAATRKSPPADGATTTGTQLRDIVIPSAILLVAALLRMGWLGTAEFKLDEAGMAQLALNLAQGKSLPLQGTGSSTGLPSAPGAAYVYAIPFLFSSDPFLATFFTAALNVIGVALCWWLARRYWGRSAAFFASLLFATSPWAVIASRKIWEPDLLPPLTLAYIITALLGFVERRRWAVTVHLALLALIVQIHFSGLALVPITVVLVIAFWRHLDWRAAAAGIAIAAIEALPFVYYVWTQRTRAALGSAAGLVSQPAQVDSWSARFWWMMSTGSDLQSLAGWPAATDFLRRVPDLRLMHSTVGMLLVAGILFLLWPGRSGREASSTHVGRLIVLWALAPLLLLLRHSTPVYTHYFYVTFPAQYVASGAFLAAIASARPKWIRWAAIGTVGAIAFAQAATLLTLLNFVGTNATPGGFGTPLRFQRQAAQRVRALGNPVIVLAADDNPMQDDWSAAFDFLLQGMPHRLFNGTHGALLPEGRATALITPGTNTAMHAYALAGLQESGELIHTRRGEEPFRVLTLAGAQRPRWQAIHPPRQLANGVAITGYLIEGMVEPGRPFTWWLVWRVEKPPPDRGARYHFFNHFVDSEGTRWTQADGPTYSTDQWLVGDVVIQAFQLQVPAGAGPGPFRMRVGMYTYPAIENIPVLDAAGNPAGDAAELPIAP